MVFLYAAARHRTFEDYVEYGIKLLGTDWALACMQITDVVQTLARCTQK